METKILLIDHNDSFTFNLVQMFEEMPGVQVNVLNVQDAAPKNISKYDGIVLSPGPGLPEHYSAIREILEKYHTLKPILGICLGLQHIVMFFGGSLINLTQVQHGKQVPLKIIDNDILFNNVRQPVLVGLYHSWAADKTNFPCSLIITSENENGTVMSLKHNTHAISAVQFHPESYMTPDGKEMLQNWVMKIKNKM